MGVRIDVNFATGILPGGKIHGTFKMRYSEYSREAYDFNFCASESIILMLIFLAVNKPKINFVI
jgi:hypothetical protein